MRKRLISPIRQTDTSAERGWLELERATLVEVSSEADAYPIEGALLNDEKRGWRAGAPGIQTIRLLFDAPQTIQTIRVVFKEEEIARTQEFVLRWLLPARIFDAIANRFLVNIQADVIHTLHEEPPWLFSESTFPLSSAFCTPVLLTRLNIQTIVQNGAFAAG